MAGKLSGSPFHVETATYKYATEQSEVPVAKSQFNQTITKCSCCAYHYEQNKTTVCTNVSVSKAGSKHCEGFVDWKSIPDLMQFKKNALDKYLSYRNHRIIGALVAKLKNYQVGSNGLIDSYCGKRWVLTGHDETYSKEDLYKLIRQLKGRYWSNLEHWDIADSDIVINMGKGPYKLKELRKGIEKGLYKDRKLPKIMTIQNFRDVIVRMLRSLTE